MNLSFETNKLIEIDGVRSGVFIIDKPIDTTSHDVVDVFRRTLKTKRVGHAGTLDPFASGVLIILVGKATKLSNELIDKDKGYKAEFLLGLETDTLDPEGSIISFKEIPKFEKLEIEQAVNDLTEITKQYVPVYSSTRFEGEKLRVLARTYDHFEIHSKSSVKSVFFYNAQNELQKSIPLPQKEIEIKQASLVGFSQKKVILNTSLQEKRFEHNVIHLEDSIAISEEQISKVMLGANLLSVEVRLECSKGSFVRSIGPALAENLFGSDFPATTISLVRESAGKYNLAEALTLENFKNQYGYK